MHVHVKLLLNEFPDLQINSGYRCERHNKAVGGASNSSHIRALAIDIQCTGSIQRFHVVRFLLGLIGCPRMFLYKNKNLIHADFDLTLPYPRLGII